MLCFADAEAVIAHVDDIGFVCQPVDQRSGQDRVFKYFIPSFKSKICGD